MSRISPPRGYTDREQQAFPAGPPRRKTRKSRRARLIELLQSEELQRIALVCTVVIETLLLLIALVPQSIWAGLGMPNGPIPDVLSPLVAGVFYILPALTGMLCRRWMPAVVLATLPAWLDLGVFAVAASGHIGPFYLVMDPHAVSTVGTLELFGVLGALGWFTRASVTGWLKRKKAKRL